MQIYFPDWIHVCNLTEEEQVQLKAIAFYSSGKNAYKLKDEVCSVNCY